MPAVDKRPVVGLKPVMPQKAAGILIEPPVSVPTDSGTIPLATAAALPPLLPPAQSPGATGFPTAPQ